MGMSEIGGTYLIGIDECACFLSVFEEWTCLPVRTSLCRHFSVFYVMGKSFALYLCIWVIHFFLLQNAHKLPIKWEIFLYWNAA